MQYRHNADLNRAPSVSLADRPLAPRRPGEAGNAIKKSVKKVAGAVSKNL